MRVLSGLLIVLTGLLLVLIPRLLFPTCGFSPLVDPERGAWMMCNVTGLMTQGAGMVTIVAAVAVLLSLHRGVRQAALALAGLAAGVVLFSVTLHPGVCRSATMPCRVGTRPAALLVGGVQLAAVLLGLRTVRRKGTPGDQ